MDKKLLAQKKVQDNYCKMIKVGESADASKVLGGSKNRKKLVKIAEGKITTTWDMIKDENFYMFGLDINTKPGSFKAHFFVPEDLRGGFFMVLEKYPYSMKQLGQYATWEGKSIENQIKLILQKSLKIKSDDLWSHQKSLFGSHLYAQFYFSHVSQLLKITVQSKFKALGGYHKDILKTYKKQLSKVELEIRKCGVRKKDKNTDVVKKLKTCGWTSVSDFILKKSFESFTAKVIAHYRRDGRAYTFDIESRNK